MKKIAVILLLALSLFGSFFAEAKAPLPCEKSRVCETCDACGVMPLRVAVREALLHDTLSQLKTERKIEQSDLVVSALLLSAENALGKGDERSAMDAAEKAISFSSESPLPHFFLSHLYRLNSKESILQALGEYATGIRLSINNFWLFTSFLGMIGLVLFITFHLCLFTFLLYCFTHYMPLWIHYVQERLPVTIYHRSISFVAALLLLALFFMLPPFWFVFISLFLFWFFYQPREKNVAIAFLVGLLFFSFLLNPLLILLTAKQSTLLSQMALNQEGDFIWSNPSFDPAEEDWKVSFIKASYKTQENDLSSAEALYKQALLKNKDAKRLLNNLGNIAFYRDNFKEAVDYYQKAIDQDHDYVAARYNMGQVDNEMLAFDKGQAKYVEAKRIDQGLTEYYAQLAAKYPNHPVIEERFTQWELWKQLFSVYWNSTNGDNNIGRFWVGDISFVAFLILIVLIGGGLFYACLKLKDYVSVQFCPMCHKAICLRCQESFTNYNLCADCGTDMVTGTAKKSGEIARKITPFFMVPGGGQLAAQKPILALCLMVPFYFSVTLMAVGDLFLTSAHWHLSIANSPLLPITIIFLYGVYLLDLYLKRER